VASCRTALHRLLEVSVTPSDVLSFFDSQIMDLVQRREDVFMTKMMDVFKAELQHQVKAAYGKAAAATGRADRAEKEVERLQARLSRRNQSWETERSELYRQILALRELLRRHGMADSAEMRALAASGLGGHDDSIGSTRAKGLEQRVKQLEAEVSQLNSELLTSQSASERLRSSERGLQDKLITEVSLHEGSKMEIANLNQDIAKLKEQLLAKRSEIVGLQRAAGVSAEEEALRKEMGLGDAWMTRGAEWGQKQLDLARSRADGGDIQWEEAAESLAALLKDTSLRDAVLNAYRQQTHAAVASGDEGGEAFEFPVSAQEESLKEEVTVLKGQLEEAQRQTRKLDRELVELKTEKAAAAAINQRRIRATQTDLEGSEIVTRGEMERQLESLRSELSSPPAEEATEPSEKAPKASSPKPRPPSRSRGAAAAAGRRSTTRRVSRAATPKAEPAPPKPEPKAEQPPSSQEKEDGVRKLLEQKLANSQELVRALQAEVQASKKAHSELLKAIEDHKQQVLRAEAQKSVAEAQVVEAKATRQRLEQELSDSRRTLITLRANLSASRVAAEEAREEAEGIKAAVMEREESTKHEQLESLSAEHREEAERLRREAELQALAAASDHAALVKSVQAAESRSAELERQVKRSKQLVDEAVARETVQRARAATVAADLAEAQLQIRRLQDQLAKVSKSQELLLTTSSMDDESPERPSPVREAPMASAQPERELEQLSRTLVMMEQRANAAEMEVALLTERLAAAYPLPELTPAPSSPFVTALVEPIAPAPLSPVPRTVPSAPVPAAPATIPAPTTSAVVAVTPQSIVAAEPRGERVPSGLLHEMRGAIRWLLSQSSDEGTWLASLLERVPEPVSVADPSFVSDRDVLEELAVSLHGLVDAQKQVRRTRWLRLALRLQHVAEYGIRLDGTTRAVQGLSRWVEVAARLRQRGAMDRLVAACLLVLRVRPSKPLRATTPKGVFGPSMRVSSAHRVRVRAERPKTAGAALGGRAVSPTLPDLAMDELQLVARGEALVVRSKTPSQRAGESRDSHTHEPSPRWVVLDSPARPPPSTQSALRASLGRSASPPAIESPDGVEAGGGIPSKPVAQLLARHHRELVQPSSSPAPRDRPHRPLLSAAHTQEAAPLFTGARRAPEVSFRTERPTQALSPRTLERPTPAVSPRTLERPTPALSPRTLERPTPALSPRTVERPTPAVSPRTLERPTPALSPRTRPIMTPPHGRRPERTVAIQSPDSTTAAPIFRTTSPSRASPSQEARPQGVRLQLPSTLGGAMQVSPRHGATRGGASNSPAQVEITTSALFREGLYASGPSIPAGESMVASLQSPWQPLSPQDSPLPRRIIYSREALDKDTSSRVAVRPSQALMAAGATTARVARDDLPPQQWTPIRRSTQRTVSPPPRPHTVGSPQRSSREDAIVEGTVPRPKGAAGVGVRVVGFRRSLSPTQRTGVQPTAVMTTVLAERDGDASPELWLRMSRDTSVLPPPQRRELFDASRSKSADRSRRSPRTFGETIASYVSTGPPPRNVRVSNAGAVGQAQLESMPGGETLDATGRMVPPSAPSIPSRWTSQSPVAQHRTVVREAAMEDSLHGLGSTLAVGLHGTILHMDPPDTVHRAPPELASERFPAKSLQTSKITRD
jgi:hypothetical protein